MTRYNLETTGDQVYARAYYPYPDPNPNKLLAYAFFSGSVSTNYDRDQWISDTVPHAMIAAENVSVKT